MADALGDIITRVSTANAKAFILPMPKSFVKIRYVMPLVARPVLDTGRKTIVTSQSSLNCNAVSNITFSTSASLAMRIAGNDVAFSANTMPIQQTLNIMEPATTGLIVSPPEPAKKYVAYWSPYYGQTLLNLSCFGSFVGSVKQQGVPIPYARVNVYDRISGQLITSARAKSNGNFRIDGLSSGYGPNYMITATNDAEGYNAIIFDKVTPQDGI